MKKIITKLSTLLLLFSATSFTACNNETLIEESQFDINDFLPQIINTVGNDDSSTRTSHGEDANGKLKVVWNEADNIEILNYKKQNLAKYKALKGGSSHTSLERVKVESDVAPNGPYIAIYPDKAFAKNDNYNLSLLGQTQQKSDPFKHLSDYNLMISKVDDLSHALNFISQVTTFKYDLKNIPNDLGKPVSIVVSVPYADNEQGYKENFADAKRVPSATLKLEGYDENTTELVAHIIIAPMSIKTGSNLIVTIIGTNNSYCYNGPLRTQDRSYEHNMRYTLKVESGWEKVENINNDCIYTDEMDEAVNNPKFDWRKYEPNGKGNPAQPFEISTAWNLAWLKAHYKYGKMNGNQNNVILTNDIVINMSKNWTPIDALQKNSHPIFDGKGHTISGWKIINSKLNNQGFFGEVSTFSICNLTVEGTIETDQNVENIGGIIAKANNGTIANCINKVTITAPKSTKNIGGIIGYLHTGTISSCTNWADIYAPNSTNVNGIVGLSINTVTNLNTNKGNITKK